MHWHDFNFLIAFTILITYILVDGMYAHYTISIVNKKPAASATTGALMHFLIAFGILNYVHNYLYIIPIAIGSWVGTYYVVRKEYRTTSKTTFEK